jgi:hypothetical protein
MACEFSHTSRAAMEATATSLCQVGERQRKNYAGSGKPLPTLIYEKESLLSWVP